MQLKMEPPRAQAELIAVAYDRWVTPDGEEKAGFYRKAGGIVARFYGEADFWIAAPVLHTGEGPVTCWPAAGIETSVPINLFTNAITPMLNNHAGGLNLHGSGVAASDKGQQGAWAFLGHSRSGKTTLAGAFSNAGYAFLTEDVVDLDNRGGVYWMQPKEAELRLFSDSARFLQDGTESSEIGDTHKQSRPLHSSVAAQEHPTPLAAIFLLGDGSADQVNISPLSPAAALTQLLPHSFVLDVEDKARLKSHFGRLADLAGAVPCYTLDYPREFAELANVISAVRAFKLEGKPNAIR